MAFSRSGSGQAPDYRWTGLAGPGGIVEIEIVPESWDDSMAREDSLEVPPLGVQEEEVPVEDLDPWGLPADYAIEASNADSGQPSEKTEPQADPVAGEEP